MNRNKKEKKVDYIELKETKENTKIHITKEEDRMIQSREVQNLKFILSKYSHITKYNWENDGDKIITDEKMYFSKKEKKILKYLLLKKLPDKHRRNFWLVASGAKREMANNREYYKNLTENFPEYIPSPYENQINMDLYRTFPDDPEFKEVENIKKLKNILLAYSRRNISIGYCQGFNFIVGRLIKVFPIEEEAFWIFVQLIENILPINYYSELAGIMVDCSILIKLINIYSPILCNHLQAIGYELSLNNILYKWFVSVFIQNLSTELSLIIWDMLFLEGNIVLFKSAIAILKILKKSILRSNTLEEINHLFDDGARNLNDYHTLIYYLILRRFEFSIDFIVRNRVTFEVPILENINRSNEPKIARNNRAPLMRKATYVKNVIECCPCWPLCIYDLNYKYVIVSFLIFKVHDPLNFIENYFFKEKNKTGINNEKFNNKIENKSKKSSKSSDTLIKINIGNINIDKTKKYKNPGNIREQLNDSLVDQDKFKLYKNLLIERRTHTCKEKSKSSKKETLVQTGQYESNDKITTQSSVSNEEINEYKEKYSHFKQRSQTMITAQLLNFMHENEVVNYGEILSNVNSNIKFSNENMEIFANVKSKKLDLEYIYEDEKLNK